jgi:hypothetical protein
VTSYCFVNFFGPTTGIDGQRMPHKDSVYGVKLELPLKTISLLSIEIVASFPKYVQRKFFSGAVGINFALP